MAKFPLGQLVATPGALQTFERNNQSPLEFIARHVNGDWGELDEADRQENELSLKRGFRILSAYQLQDQTKIWIITEADRSATTILLPEEYSGQNPAKNTGRAFSCIYSSTHTFKVYNFTTTPADSLDP